MLAGVVITTGVVASMAEPAFADTTLCSGSSYSSCTNMNYTDHGYSAHSSTSYWGAFAGHNCTNYAAFTAQTVDGAAAPNYSLGNASDWYNNAHNHGVTTNQTPAKGAIAWWRDAGWNGGGGHVAFVEDKNPDGSIVISDDSYSNGPFRWMIITPNSWFWPQGFIHFKDLPATPATDNNTIRLKKTYTAADSTDQVYAATTSRVTESFWNSGSNGVHTNTIFNAPAGETIVDFDKVTEDDGVTQNLYVATTSGVYEVWWQIGGSGVSDAAKIVNLPNTKRVVADEKIESGTVTHRLYVLANDGPYEVWWRAGTGVSNPYRLWNINGGLSIVKSTSPTGADEVFVASPSNVYEMRWPNASGGIDRTTVTALADTVDVAKMTASNGTELVYTATKTGVHETWWQGGGSGPYSSPAKIVTVPSGETVVSIKRMMQGDTNQLYVATGNNVRQYWWNATSGGVQGGGSLINITQNDIRSFDVAGTGAIQNLFTAHQSWVYDTWWGDGGLHNGNPIINLN